ncbi:MAG: hypothetical protein ABIK77_00560 [candidate division WOR-3 bacterium]
MVSVISFTKMGVKEAAIYKTPTGRFLLPEKIIKEYNLWQFIKNN